MFFGLLFAISHYCLLVIATREIEIALWMRGVCFSMAMWCIFNIIFNYLMTVIVAPGTPSDIPSGMLSQIRYNCRRCGVTKPPRTHHCSICNRCVIQMDRTTVGTQTTVRGLAPAWVTIIESTSSIFLPTPPSDWHKCSVS